MEMEAGIWWERGSGKGEKAEVKGSTNLITG